VTCQTLPLLPAVQTPVVPPPLPLPATEGHNSSTSPEADSTERAAGEDSNEGGTDKSNDNSSSKKKKVKKLQPWTLDDDYYSMWGG
jgi:hypothetical protein